MELSELLAKAKKRAKISAKAKIIKKTKNNIFVTKRRISDQQHKVFLGALEHDHIRATIVTDTCPNCEGTNKRVDKLELIDKHKKTNELSLNKKLLTFGQLQFFSELPIKYFTHYSNVIICPGCLLNHKNRDDDIRYLRASTFSQCI